MKRTLSIAAVLTAAWMGTSAQATEMLYDGSIKSQLGGSGSSYSFGHEATNNYMNPNGDHAQYAGGSLIFGIQDGAEFHFSVHNNVLAINNAIFDIYDDDGSPLLGTMSLSGNLDIDYGAAHSNQHDAGISGSLDYVIEFTNTTYGGYNYYDGNILEGTFYFQAADFGGQFNGISFDGDMVNFSLWGDNRPSLGNGNLADPDGTLTGWRKINGYWKWREYHHWGFGLDLVAMGQKKDVPPPPNVVPLPAPALAGMVLLSGIGGVRILRRIRRKDEV